MICNDANFGHWHRVLYNINDTDDIHRKCSESTIEHPIAWRILALWVAPLQAVPRLGAAWSRSFPKTGIKPSEMNSHQKHPETSKHHHSTDSTTSTCEKNKVLRMVVILMYEYNMYTWGRESSWYITISSSNAALVFDSYSKWFAVIAYLVLAIVPKVLPRLTT